MPAFLKNHPFAVEAFFKTSIVFTFAAPKEQLSHLLPPCLALDTFQDKWGFIAIAMVQTQDLRPKGLPRFLGNDFFLIGYRIFVRYTNTAGRRLRGLYILGSETDKKNMAFFGNVFTNYKYHTTDIEQAETDTTIRYHSKQSNFDFTADVSPTNDVALPENSPFQNWKEARRFAGPLPFTFTWQPETREVLIIEGVRQNWEPEPIEVLSWRSAFIDSMALPDLHLANAFIIRNVPYAWKKGKREKWQ